MKSVGDSMFMSIQRNGVQLADSQASSSANLRINVGAVPLCPPVRWRSGVRLFVDSSIRLIPRLVPQM